MDGLVSPFFHLLGAVAAKGYRLSPQVQALVSAVLVLSCQEAPVNGGAGWESEVAFSLRSVPWDTAGLGSMFLRRIFLPPTCEVRYTTTDSFTVGRFCGSFGGCSVVYSRLG
jgi:hypothetical protein